MNLPRHRCLQIFVASVSSFLPVLLSAKDIAPDHPAIVYANYVHLDLDGTRARFDRRIDASSGFRHDNPGVTITFRTTARSVQARFHYNGLHQRQDARNSLGVYYIDGEQAGSFSTTDPRPCRIVVPVLDGAPATEKEIRIVLPYGDSVDFEGLIVDEDAQLSKTEIVSKPRLTVYGDSITHGFRAGDITKTYPYLLAKEMDWACVNMGFGSRQATGSDGAVLAEIPSDFLLVLIGFNDHYRNKKLDQYRTDLVEIIRLVRDRNPHLPIHLITPLWSTEPHASKLGLSLEDYREVVRRIVSESDDPHLHLIEGLQLIPNHRKYFTDGIHPNDAGFHELANNLAAHLAREANAH